MSIKLQTPLTQVDTTAQFTEGTQVQTKDGNEYVYLPGVASTAQYDVVTVQTANGLSYGSVTRLTQANSAIGPVAIAQAAIVSNRYGWFLVRGVGWANASNTFSSGSPLYASGTTGAVTSIPVQYVGITGLIAVGTASGVASGTVKVLANYPFMTQTAL